MPTKAVDRLQNLKDQASTRWPETVYDQHKSARFPRGRPWWGWVEQASNRKDLPAFCSELIPGRSVDEGEDPKAAWADSWHAPWYPDQVLSHRTNFFRLDMKRLAITWLYPAIIAEDRAANDRYWEAAFKISYEKGWAMPDVNAPPPYQIRSLLLEPPRSPKIAEAAMAGDPWILGHTDQVNEELSAILAGTRVMHDERVPVVTPEQVLSTDATIQAMVAKAVAEALAAQDEQRRAKKASSMANARSSRRTSTTATSKT